MKHSIVIYTDKNPASAAALSEITAGIEEEGVRYEISSVCSEPSPRKIFPKGSIKAAELAEAAAKESAFGCGVGIYAGHAALWLASHGMEIIFAYNQESMRLFGLNSGRALKKLPFYTELR